MSNAKPRTAVLLDRHPLWLDAVARVAETVDVEVLAQTSDAQDAIAMLEQHRPSVFVTDLQTRDASPDGTQCIRRARELNPSVKTIVLSESDDPVLINGAFAAGALAYVIKTAHVDDIAAAFRQVFDHSIYLSPPAQTQQAPTAIATNGVGELTRRELEILTLAADGHSNARMAEMLWVTEQTIKFHLSNIYRKLDVANRTEASRWAQVHGILPTPEAAELSRPS
jgi:DNA-binding NarL/FixJ family response regulator